MSLEIRILEKQTLYKNHSKLERITFEKAENGETRTFERELFSRPPAAAILLYNTEQKTVILTSQFRLPVYLDKREPLIETCAGLLDEGELPEHAIVREVEEETGYRISEIEKIAECYSSPAAYTEYVYLFVGKYSPDMKVNQGGGLKEEGENIEILEFTADELKEKFRKGKIKDMKSIVLIQHALIHNLI